MHEEMRICCFELRTSDFQIGGVAQSGRLAARRMLTVGAAETSSRKGSPSRRRSAMPVVRPVALIAMVTLTMGLALVVSGGALQKNAAAAFESCGITKTPTEPFVSPSPYPAKTHSDYFWFGTNKLWTQLRKDGTWQGLPNGPTAPFGRRSSGSARAIVGIAIRSQDWRSPGNVWMCGKCRAQTARCCQQRLDQ
jgi:hypothetical protein